MTPAMTLAAFGDLEQKVWGALWLGTEQSFAVAGPIDAASRLEAPELHGHDSDEEWTLRAEQAELRLAPAGEPARDGEQDGFDQLCRVTGTLAGAPEPRELDCVGRRALRAAFDPAALDSLRDFSAWFDADSGVVLTAERPRAATGHDADAVRAALFEPANVQSIADPRLSTTYSSERRPIKLSLELWLEQADEQEQLYPRRAAGRALSPGVSAPLAGFTLDSIPFRVTTGGKEGIGVYMLARSR